MQDAEAREFHLGEDFFRRARRLYLVRGVLLTLLALIFIVLLPALYAPRQTLASTLIVGGMLCAIMPMAMMRGYRRTVARYQDFRIVLFPQGLKHSLPGQEDIYIGASEVSRVIRSPGNGCGVEGMAGLQAIWIPATLLGYDELMRTVETWRTSEIRAGFWRKGGTQLAATAAFVGATLAVLQSENRTLVTAVGAPLLAYTGWSAMTLRRSPYVNARQKRGAGALWFIMALFTWKIVHLWLA